MNEEQMKYVANLISQDIEKDKEIERQSEMLINRDKEFLKLNDEIERLNNIIEEFEKWITFSDTESFNPALNYDDECKMDYIYVDDLLDKLKELKEGKECQQMK